VVPAGDGLVPPSPDGPVQREGEAGAGDQPGGVLPGQTGKPGGLGDRQPDGGDAGRAGLAAADRDGRVTEGISRSASLESPSSMVSLVPCPGPGSGMWRVSALRMAAARSWARAAGAVWRQMLFQLRAWVWSQPSTSLPVLNVSCTGQRRPAMVMKYVMVAGRPGGAQHR